VNVTDCVVVPTAGTVLGVVKAKLPATLALPPLKVELASVCPDVMTLAVGCVLIVGVELLMVIVSVPFPVPPALVALIATADIPSLVGVPLITPVAVLIVSPAVRPVAP
jgi:hypothetical protein